MDRASVIERNRVELGRLRELLAQLSDEQLAHPLEGGWTVGATLAHLAFWDQRAVHLLDRWEKQGVGPSEMDVDILNRACLPQWLALAPRTAADIALKTAEAIDKKIESISQEIFDWCLTNPVCPINIERYKHRAEHIEQIQQAVSGK
jgi:hypothetical protein